MWQLKSFSDSRKCLFAFAIIVAISSVQCQIRPQINPEHVELNEGNDAEIMCSFTRKIERCRIYLPNGSSVRIREGEARDRFVPFGNGFANGECGVKITNLNKQDEGVWRCSLDVGDDLDDVEGNFTIMITKAPQNLELYVPDANNLREGVDMQAECTFSDGIPAAQIEWFLGEEQVQPREALYNEKQNIVQSIFRRILRVEDNMKNLVCRISHPALNNGSTFAQHQLHVNYPPQALSRPELFISGLTIGSTADIEVRIRSNPRPNLQWTVDGQTMKESEQRDRFVVYSATPIGDGRFLAKLSVVELTLEDTLKTYNIRASNEFGSQDYQIRIGGSSEENSSGLGIVAIIGIIIAALVVLIIVALLVVARVTKRWCFAGASMHPNSPDSEAQIAPDEDKTHEQYEQHDGKISDEENGGIDHKTTSNGKSNGNTSV